MRTREALERARQSGPLTRLMLFLNDRALEWFSAFVMLGWGVTLLFPGDTLAGAQYAAFARFGMTEEFWSWAFSIVGIARLVALYINGRWPKSPHIRMAGSLFGALSWAQVSYLLFVSSWAATGVPTTGPVVYGLLAMADLLGIARAAFDARYYLDAEHR